MGKVDYPITPAVRMLREKKIDFEPHIYAYKERGGTRRSAEELRVDEHSVIKTLVMEDDSSEPMIVLMHGDREVSTRELARKLGVKSVSPCDPAVAEKHTGYQVGGTSPFGTRKSLPVVVEKSILDLPKIYINGGKRGFLVSVDPKDLPRALRVTEVNVAIAHG
ncbi:MAG TPA: Cys-tRNA(Pro) deacylase [Blastocatellia bacterium]|nr:Cys-tRNA(Pro) deacylase [Blastocatellia bacterium]